MPFPTLAVVNGLRGPAQLGEAVEARKTSGGGEMRAMDFKSFVDKAKDAAAAAARDVAGAMSSPAAAPVTAPAPPEETPTEGQDLVTTPQAEQSPAAAAPAAPGKSFSALANEKLNQLSAAGAGKIQELVTSFQQSLPAIKSAGYELTEFEVELGVTPKLIPHFRHAPKSVEDVDAARESLRDNKLGMLILGALLKAGDVHKQIKVAGFGFSHIEIELGIIPSVRLQYKRGGE